MNYAPRSHRFPAVLAIGLAALATLPTVQATILPGPTVNGGSTPFSGYSLATATDNTVTEYASNNAGDATFLTMSFAGPTTFDRVIALTRNSPAAGDRFAQFTLTFDGGPTQTFLGSGAQLQSGIYSIPSPVTATNVRFDVDTLASGTTGNTGVAELMFLQTPVGSQIATGVSVIDGSTPFSSGFSLNKAADGSVGVGNEYASSNQGLNTYLTFDLGALKSITGFDYIDRISELTSAYRMTFSTDTTFDGSDTFIDFTKGATAIGDSHNFAGIDARYVRFDMNGGAPNNPGVGEMIFYTAVPEPGAWMSLLGGTGVLLGLRRRRVAL